MVQALRRVVRNPMGLIGLSVLVVLVVCAITAPLLAPYDPVAQHPGQELRPPSLEFLLGSDNLGRDLLSRIIFGSRNSLLVGVVAVGLAPVSASPPGCGRLYERRGRRRHHALL